MMKRRQGQRSRGFTLIELLIVIALISILLMLTVPSFKNFILDQRLKSIQGQLLTDLQFARAEAAARNMPVYISFRSSPGNFTCYTIYTTTQPGSYCSCTLGAGAACANAWQAEIRTQRFLQSDGIKVTTSPLNMAFDNVNGGIVYGTSDFTSATPIEVRLFAELIVDPERMLKTVVSPGGRPTVCSAGTKLINGYSAC